LSPLRRRRPLEGVQIMCAKRQRRCSALLAIREEVLMEWSRAETFEQVRSCWARLGGRTTLHRYGRSGQGSAGATIGPNLAGAYTRSTNEEEETNGVRSDE
jgi:hypothetical protein